MTGRGPVEKKKAKQNIKTKKRPDAEPGHKNKTQPISRRKLDGDKNWKKGTARRSQAIPTNQFNQKLDGENENFA